MPSIKILVIGDAHRSEFREAAAVIGGCGDVETVAGVDEAEFALRAGAIAPEAIIIAQPFPDRFSHEAIDRLARAAPLARILGLMGSWCEGEMRTGRPWPSSSRLYWHQWSARCRRQFQRMNEGRLCSFSLPATATEEERLLADLSFRHYSETKPRTECTAGLAVVSCRSFNTWEMAAEACRHRGMAAVWRRDDAARIENATVALFDCDEFGGVELGRLRRLSAAMGNAPVIAMASFPRIEDHRRALAAGAAAVVSKPFLWDDLFDEIDRATAVAG